MVCIMMWNFLLLSFWHSFGFWFLFVQCIVLWPSVWHFQKLMPLGGLSHSSLLALRNRKWFPSNIFTTVEAMQYAWLMLFPWFMSFLQKHVSLECKDWFTCESPPCRMFLGHFCLQKLPISHPSLHGMIPTAWVWHICRRASNHRPNVAL